MSELQREPLRVVGLRYEPAEGPPQVVLKAAGELAEEVLLRRRRSADAAPVVKNQALLEQLYRLPVEGHIGPELYCAVAVLIAHVLDVEAKLIDSKLAAANITLTGDPHA
jgi:type III secretion system FlhB-like substrate exporter